MYSQRKIIRVLLVFIGIELSLFINYYIYNDFINKSSIILTVPHKLITIEDMSLPKSILFDILAVEVIEKKVLKKVLKDKIKRISPNNSEDIVRVSSYLVKPILYTNSVPLSSLSIPEKKQKFIDMMIPSILVAKHQMRLNKERVAGLIIKLDISKKDEKWLKDKRQEFQALDNYELHNKMESHPTSIVIAQAIVESGWGTSKFFQKANNVFGVWSFSENDNRISASKKRGDKTIYLKKYKSIEESIYDYFVTIARKDCYKLFQKKRLITQDPYKLVNYLIKYSERGESYTRDLKNMIRQNSLSAYDGYRLDL